MSQDEPLVAVAEMYKSGDRDPLKSNAKSKALA